MRSIPTALLFLLSVVCAQAQMSVGEYQKSMATKDPDVINLVKTYIKGIGDGFVYFGVRAESSPKFTPLFCQPDGLALRTENFVDILNGEIKKASAAMSKEKLDQVPIPTILLSGLQATFPCKGK